jgi:NADH dehydrogenase
MKSTLFITGASGFIGRHLLARLDPADFSTVFCLSRNGLAGAPSGFHTLAGSLFDADRYASALERADTVVHLAAATGNAPAHDHFRVNAEGTRFLIRQCETLGVKRFLYVSSIAARFPDTRHYPYAQSKRQGEAAVRDSKLAYTIVRPTIVLGRASPIGRRLHALATAALTPVLGRGTARIQPIDVDDLASCLLAIITNQRFANEVLELGGPEVMTMQALLTRMHRLEHNRNPRLVHLPAGVLRSALAWLERLPIPLPVSAGQLASFVNDGVAEENDLAREQRPRMKSVDQMLEVLRHHA